MRVRVWLEQEVEVDVSFKDVLGEFHSMEKPEQLELALRGINGWYSFLNGIPDSVIEQMNDAQLRTIANALEPLTARFRQTLVRRQSLPVEEKAT